MMEGHAHLSGMRNESKSKMLMVLGLTSLYMVIEVIAAYYTHSLALMADAGHMLSDVGSILLALLAFWFSARPATPGKTYGYYRSEILAGLINGVLLVGISLFILFESYHRLINPPEVMTAPMLMVALLGLVINLISVKLLGKLAEHSVNVRAAYLEVLGDLLATFAVIIASLIMMFSKWYIADALVSGAIGLLILPRTWLLLTECTNILMEGTPGHINLSDLRQSMLKVPGVVDVHDIHVWTITSGLDAMSGHVTISKEHMADQVLLEITQIAQGQFGIHHTTIQVEQIECKSQGLDSCGS